MSPAPSARSLWARPELRWLALITLGAAAIRFSTLHLQSFAYDEVFTADRVIHSGLHATLSAVKRTESTPPLYYIAAWVWAKFFGTGEIGLRSLSALIGTAMVPVTYAAATVIASRRVGLIAALFVAVNPAFVWYSQQARSYILLGLLTAVGLSFFVRALRDRDAGSHGEKWTLGLWVLASALNLATHYFAIFVVAPEALWLLIAYRDCARRASWAVGGVVAVGLALLPLAITQQKAGHADFISGIDLGKRITEVPKLFFIGPQAVNGFWPAFAIVALLAIGALLIRRGEPAERKAATIWTLIAAAGVALPLLAVAVGIDFFFARNLLAAFIPAILALALVAGSPVSRRFGPLAAAVLVALSLAAVLKTDLDKNWQRADWRLVARLAGSPQAGRVIIINSRGDVPLGHYLPIRGAPPSLTGLTQVIYAGADLTRQLARTKLPSQLTLVQERSSGGLEYRRYASQTPLTVPLRALLGVNPGVRGGPQAFVDARKG